MPLPIGLLNNPPPFLGGAGAQFLPPALAGPPSLAAQAAQAAGSAAGSAPGIVGRFANNLSFMPGFKEASIGAKAGGLAKLLGYPLAGRVVGNAITGLAGGAEATEKNKYAEFARGGAKGAGLGAGIGSAVPVVGTALGGLIGGIAGGAADVLDLSHFLKGKTETPNKKAYDGFNSVLRQITSGDSEVQDLIKKQVDFTYQTNLLGVDNPSTQEKEAAYAAAKDAGLGLLQQYMQSPVAFRVAAGFGQKDSHIQDSLALQATIAGYINPIADEIANTGKAQAQLYGDYATAHPGDKTAALNLAGQSFANSSSNLANAYRMQAHLMPAMMNRQMDQSTYAQQNQQQLAQSLSAQGAQAYGYGDQSNVSATDPSMDAFLAQIGGGQ